MGYILQMKYSTSTPFNFISLNSKISCNIGKIIGLCMFDNATLVQFLFDQTLVKIEECISVSNKEQFFGSCATFISLSKFKSDFFYSK